MIATKIPRMAKRSAEKTETIRVKETIARMIEIICTAEGVSTSDVASPILEKALGKRYLDAVDAIARQGAEYKKERQ